MAALGATLGLLAGCGSSSSGSKDAAVSKTNFCAVNAKLDKRTNVSTLDGLLKALKSNEGTIKDFGQAAPTAIKTQAAILVSASENGIKTGSTAGFDQKFINAGKAVDSYCAKK